MYNRGKIRPRGINETKRKPEQQLHSIFFIIIFILLSKQLEKGERGGGRRRRGRGLDSSVSTHHHVWETYRLSPETITNQSDRPTSNLLCQTQQRHTPLLTSKNLSDIELRTLLCTQRWRSRKQDSTTLATSICPTQTQLPFPCPSASCKHSLQIADSAVGYHGCRN